MKKNLRTAGALLLAGCMTAGMFGTMAFADSAEDITIRFSWWGGDARHAATLEAIEKENMLENCRKMGDYLMEKLTAMTKPYAFVKGVRGKGLMLGIVLDHSGAALKSKLQDNGLIALTAGETVVRFLPALNLSKEIADEALAIIEKSLAEYAASL